MKIWLKLVLGIIGGLIAGLLVPETSQMIISFCTLVGKLSLNILLYFTAPYIVTKVYVGILSMRSTKVKVGRVTLIFFGFVLASLFLSVLFSMFIMNVSVLQGEGLFELIQKKTPRIELSSFSDILLRIFSDNPFYHITQPLVYILPLIFLAVILAYGTINAGKKGIYFSDIIKSFSDILDVIAVYFVEIFSVLSIFLVTSIVIAHKSEFHVSIFFRPLFAIAVVMTLIAIILYVLVRFIYKDEAFHYFSGIFGAALTGLITGNSASTILPLSLHLKRNINIDDDTADYLTPFGVVFNRTGTVVVASIVLMSIIISLAPSTLTLKTQILLFIYVLLFSFRLDGVNELGSMVLIAMILREPAFNFEENSYLLFIGIAPVLSRIAVFINTFTSGIYIMLTVKYTGGQTKIQYRDFI